MSDQRHGDGWETFLATYKLRSIKDTADGYEVESASGSTYQVSDDYGRDSDGCLGVEFNCSCPARGSCRHIDAVQQMLYCEAAADAKNGDTTGMDLVERFRGGE